MDNLMSYSSRTDIMAEVLQSMSSGNITSLTGVYLAFLAKEYLAYLEDRGLVRFDAPSRTYGMTKEGAKVLGKVRDLGTLLNLERPMNQDITGSYIITEPAVRNRSRVADKRELDSRPITTIIA
jgi:predicted transcriptional regulator